MMLAHQIRPPRHCHTRHPGEPPAHAPERMPRPVRVDLTEARNRVLFSTASLWETTITSSLNRADCNFDSADIERLLIAQTLSLPAYRLATDSRLAVHSELVREVAV